MDTCMNIELAFTDNAFEATARIVLDPLAAVKSFSFLLNAELTISEIQCNRKTVDFKEVSKETPEFRSPSRKIFFQWEDTVRAISIHYSGTVAFSFENWTNWYNCITEEFKSLSWYSVWYPQETSIEIKQDKVTLFNGSEYFLVKGEYDETRNVWEYGGKGYDPYNIVAYRKEALKTISNPYLNIYFVDENIKEQAEKLTSIYRDILDFYNGNLFSRKEIPVLDIACASPAITVGGGYRRTDFMWCTTPGDSDLGTAWLTAHETAHIWCSGADCGSWEDWLNETTAEWASLLFALSQNNTTLFDFILKPKREQYDSFPRIKTPDGHRPYGVHEKGTVLFYRLYQTFGVEAVRFAVRTFTDLKVKNTASLLQRLSEEGRSEIAEFIEKGIVS